MAKFDITQVPDTELGDGRAQFTGTVSWPEHENHDPDGNPTEDVLTFPVDVYMPIDESDRNEQMQTYADDYEAGYWQGVRDGINRSQGE